MNNIIITTFTSTTTSIYPAFATWRFHRNYYDGLGPLNTREKLIDLLLILGMVGNHVTEVTKAIYFGLSYQNADASSMLIFVDLAAEFSRLMIVSGVLMRTITLVTYRQKAGKMIEKGTVVSLLLARFTLPPLYLYLYSNLDTFGIYGMVALTAEGLIFGYSSIVTCLYLNFLRLDDSVDPIWKLYSNSIITISLSFVALLFAIIEVSTNYASSVILSSLYSVIIGLGLLLYQDSTDLIGKAGKNSSKGVRRLISTLSPSTRNP